MTKKTIKKAINNTYVDSLLEKLDRQKKVIENLNDDLKIFKISHREYEEMICKKSDLEYQNHSLKRHIEILEREIRNLKYEKSKNPEIDIYHRVKCENCNENVIRIEGKLMVFKPVECLHCATRNFWKFKWW